MLQVIQTDITILALDAIVNAANETLLGGGGVDGAIHRAAGPELYNACRALGGCPTGGARVTAGYNLPSKWVIHAVGPRWRGGGHGEAELLESCYDSAFRLALDKEVGTIAFPCIATGIYGYPRQEAAEIAVSVMQTYRDRFERIISCCFGVEEKRIYDRIVGD